MRNATRGETKCDSEARGELASLEHLLRRVPQKHARTVRELAQKECDADLRAHDALMSRGNALLAASGVAVALLVQLRGTIDGTLQKVFWCLALLAAVLALVSVMLSMLVRSTETGSLNSEIAGQKVTEAADQEAWVHD